MMIGGIRSNRETDRIVRNSLSSRSSRIARSNLNNLNFLNNQLNRFLR